MRARMRVRLIGLPGEQCREQDTMTKTRSWQERSEIKEGQSPD